MRIVPALDEAEDGSARLGVRGEPIAIQELALEGRKETFGHRIVEAVPDRSARRTDAQRGTTLAEGERGVLRAVIGVMNHIRWTPLLDRHVQRVEH